jgi:hypothetical protein
MNRFFQWKLNQVRIWSHHFFLYNFRSLLSADFEYKRWVRKKIFVCKRFFKKCNLRFSIAFEEVEMMKNRSQFMFCVKMSQAAIQKQNCEIIWCDYNHVMWLKWLCIERDNFEFEHFNIYRKSFILNRILSNITMRFIIYTFDTSKII